MKWPFVIVFANLVMADLSSLKARIYMSVRLKEIRTLTTFQDEEDATHIVQNLSMDLEGFIHVADDGVARSYASNGTVIDWAKLNNTQLISLIPMLVSSHSDRDHLVEVWKDVDGNDVQDMKQILEPRRSVLPMDFGDGKPIAENQSRKTKQSVLDERANFCTGQLCSSHGACQYLGCAGCFIADKLYSKHCL